MISLPAQLLKTTCKIHTDNVVEIIKWRIRILSLCLKYYSNFSKKSRDEFEEKIRKDAINENLKVQTVNWFLKKSTRSVNGKIGKHTDIKSLNHLNNFYIKENRIIGNSFNTIKGLEKRLQYFNEARLKSIIQGLPNDLLKEHEKYNKYFEVVGNEELAKQNLRLLSFLFDYDEFSDKDSIFTSNSNWGVYKLTETLGIRTCLYCNRNYIFTITDNNYKIIRPELDHFFLHSKYPILRLSFYNLIPSCHICNSNLKHTKSFNLDKNFHPYLNSFENEKIYFTYKANNPGAFFNDSRNLEIKLYCSSLLPISEKAKNNIEIFKLDYIYNQHKDVVNSLIELQRITNKKRITDIYENVLKDSAGRKFTKSKKEVYELAIRNYFTFTDFHKKPLAKFERDIAEEIGLI